jgi:hypothetical protein
MSGLAGCADDPLGDLRAPGAAAGARKRFVVSLAGPPPDLTEYRRLLKDAPGSVAGYVEERRAALVRNDVGEALGGLNARVVGRWWMSGQLTVEASPEQIDALKALPGVSGVAPDVSLP